MVMQTAEGTAHKIKEKIIHDLWKRIDKKKMFSIICYCIEKRIREEIIVIGIVS